MPITRRITNREVEGRLARKFLRPRNACVHLQYVYYTLARKFEYRWGRIGLLSACASGIRCDDVTTAVLKRESHSDCGLRVS